VKSVSSVGARLEVLQQGRQLPFHGFPHGPKRCHHRGLAALHLRGIRKVAVDFLPAAQPARAFLRCPVAHGDHEVYRDFAELINRLAPKPARADACLQENAEGKGVHVSRRTGSRGEGAPPAPPARVDDGFRDRRSAGVASADEQHASHPRNVLTGGEARQGMRRRKGLE
jgi:hypothetical protein